MKIAIIGSSTMTIDLESYIPTNVSLIILGGGKYIGEIAQKYAQKHNIQTYILLPNYAKDGKNATLIRNQLIVQQADFILAFWDGHSASTHHSINIAKQLGKAIQIILPKDLK